MFGVGVSYAGTQTQGMFFLYPILDERNRTIAYYAFDTAEQKKSFESIIKISGIGPKTWYELARANPQELQQAVSTFDVSYFQSIKGIGPKTAKKILVELKESFSDTDLIKINADDRLVKDIVKSLGQMGYNRQEVLQYLSQYEEEISQDTLQIVVNRLIKRLQ